MNIKFKKRMLVAHLMFAKLTLRVLIKRKHEPDAAINRKIEGECKEVDLVEVRKSLKSLNQSTEGTML